MPRSDPPRVRSPSGLLLAVAVAVLTALGALLWLAGAPAEGRLSPAVSLLGGLALLALAAACAAAGALWGRQRHSTALREARMGQQMLAQLADAWLWQTDNEHRLRQWRPPQDAPASAWGADPLLGTPLWEQFELIGEQRQPAALQARLQALSPLEDLRARRLGSTPQPGTQGGVAGPWRLRGLPQFDSDGGFTGYLGSALPLGDAEQQRFDQALLQRLWPELDFAVLALRPQADREWAVATLSHDAARLLRMPATQIPGLPWPEAQARLPAALAAATAELAPGQTRDEGEWTLSLHDIAPDSPPGGASLDGPAHDPARVGRLLMLRPRATVTTSSASSSDHESFIYSVSHDLRAPIRVVEGFARILKEDYGRFLDRIGNDHVDRVLAAAARMNSMIDALLALSRLQSQPLTHKPVDLSQLATYIVEDLRRESPERAAEIHIEPGIIVSGDPTLLRIAMENLLGNAWKYSGQCPLARLEFRRDILDGQRRLLVSDNGAGFDMRFADRLFGVFQRLHSPKDFAGTGVGLASVRRIVRRHGGDVWAEAEVGKGARFYFTLGA